MRLLPLLLTAGLVTGICPVFGVEIVFEKDVKPILRKKCWGCHGPEQQMGSFRLDQKERAMIAGRGMPAIVPRVPQNSLMYRRISGSELGPQMPLTGPLSAEEIATIKAWIDQGARWPDEPKPQPAWQADSRMGALFEQLHEGKFGLVRKAVEADRSLLSARNAQGTTLLMEAVLNGRAEDIRWLLAQGADPNAADAAGVTALMWATEDAEKVRALLAAGANVGSRSGDGQTALTIALEQASAPEVVKLLLAHGAKTTPEQGSDPLVLAARNGDPQSMKLLMPQPGAKCPPAAFTGAAYAECVACVRLILECGASKTVVSTALRIAATTGSLQLLNALLAAGGDVNDKGAHATTALMQAAYSDYAEVERVKFLLDHGADINARNEKGDTALRIAKRKGATKVVELLVSFGAQE